MGFSDFHGNEDIIHRLRGMLARDHFPHAVILAGPCGAGKYTLAQMLAKAMNCMAPKLTDGLPDFCGQCANCLRIAQADDLETRFGEAVEARDAMREADKKDTRIFVQTHPDVLVVPPDPPQMMIKVDQVRRVNETIRYLPGEARRRVYIFTESNFMKEAANALLKVLEEPPDFATLFLLAENASSLLPTIRSRSVIFTLAPLADEEIEKDLALSRPQWNPKQRALAARLSAGALGRARTFNLEAYTSARKDALIVLNSAIQEAGHSALFQVTETYRAGAEGRAKTEQLLGTICSLLEDMIFLQSGVPEFVRNTDITGELKKLAPAVDFTWITSATERVDEVRSGMRRNLLHSLSLDVLATALEK